jgi:hypothetical protein
MVRNFLRVRYDRRNNGQIPPCQEADRSPSSTHVNFEINDLKTFPHLVFPRSKDLTARKIHSFAGEWTASFDAPIRLCSC